MDNILTMKKLLTLIFVAFAFVSQAQPIQADPNIIIGEDSNYADYWDIKATTDRLDIDGVGISTPIIRLVDYIGPKLIYVNASGDLTLISDGTSGQALTTNGAGVYSFSTVAATPGGSTTQLQYNNAGAFGGITGATTNGTSVTLTSPTISGGTINNATIGATTPSTGAFTTVTSSAQIKSYYENPVLLIQDIETNALLTDSRLRLAESAAAGALGSYWDVAMIGPEFQIQRDGVNYFTISTATNAVSLPQSSSFSAGNITIDGNTISSTDTNGNITLDPNGTGDVFVATGSSFGVGTTNTSRLVAIRGTTSNHLSLEYDADNATLLYPDSEGVLNVSGTTTSSNLVKLRLLSTSGLSTSSGNIGIGTETFGTSATKTLGIANGAVPTTSPVDMVQLYAEDVAASSELKVRDEAGNITVLSPHNFTGIPEGKSEEMAWAFYSEKDGKYVNVDMLKMARLLEQLTGEKLVYTGSTEIKPNPDNK